jgi:N-acyl-D-amino-acid deacylase
MDESDVERIMRFDGTMIGSDGLPGDERPHPRLWGTFPRVLGRYVRDRKVLTLQEAVHRMTGLPAKRFGLRDRGVLTAGMYADVCVFDADTIVDTASFEQPAQAAIGIRYVFVNGEMALSGGTPTGRRVGRILRH